MYEKKKIILGLSTGILISVIPSINAFASPNQIIDSAIRNQTTISSKAFISVNSQNTGIKEDVKKQQGQRAEKNQESKFENEKVKFTLAQELNQISIQGELLAHKDEAIAFKILNNKDEVVYINSYDSNKEGLFNFNFNFDNNTTGMYTAKLNSSSLNGAIEHKFDYVKYEKIVSIETLKDITINVGEELVLPNKVKVKMENGEIREVPVNWNNNIDNKVPGEYNIEGIVQGTDLKAMLKLTVKEKVTSIVSLEKLSDVELGYGQKYTLPDTVKATMDDGKIEDVKVTWSSAVDTKVAGIYDLKGTVKGTTLKAKLKVTVKSEVINIVSIEKLKDVELKFAEEYKLPKTVKATMSNGKVQDVKVTWDSDIDTNVPGVFNLIGDVEGSDLKARLRVTVKEEQVNIVSIEKLNDVELGFNQEYILPKTVKVTMSNGKVQDVKVTWNSDIDTNVPGVYNLEGAVKGTNLKAKLTVTVKEETINIVSIEKLNNIELEFRQQYKLPETVKATMSNGKKQDVKVTWNGTIDTEVPGVFNLEGIIAGTNLKAKLTVTVKEEQVNIVSIEKLKDVELGVGQAYTLPETVKVIMSNGKQQDVQVIWNADVDTKVSGVYNLEGTVDGTNLKAKLRVTVKEEEVNIVSIEKLNDVELEFAQEYRLPKTVKATMSNGKIQDIQVTWNGTIDTKVPGVYNLEGTIAGTNLKAKLKVTVKSEVIEQDPRQYVYDLEKIVYYEDLSDDVLNAKAKFLVEKSRNEIAKLEYNEYLYFYERVNNLEQYIYGVDSAEPIIEDLEQAVKKDLSNSNNYYDAQSKYNYAINNFSYYKINQATYTSLNKRIEAAYKIIKNAKSR